jgi:DNA-binding PadR family transcriptional regulator
MYGYQIKQQIETRHLNHWAHVSLPSIYNTLNRLEKRGLIAAHQEKVGKMPERTVYHLTSKGERGLARLVEKALVGEKAPEDDFSVGVAFMYGLDKEKAEICLKKKLELLRGHLDHLKEELEVYEDHIPFNWLSLIRVGMGHIQLQIDHVKGMLRIMKKGRTWSDLIKGKGPERRRT